MPYIIINYRRFEPIIEAFKHLGYEVVDLSTVSLRTRLDDAVLYLVCMYDEIKSPMASLLFKHQLARNGVPVIAWNRDGPANKGEKAWRMWLLRHLPYFDIYATHTLQGADSFKAKSLYLPNAAWVTRYNLGQATLEDLRNPDGYQYDVSFFGRTNPKTYPEMRKRHEFLSALKSRLDAFGIRYLFTDAPLDFDAQRTLIQRTCINLNVHAGCDSCYHGKVVAEPSWGLPERCYGIPACGGFLLSDQRRHGSDDFKPETEWIAFSNIEECLEKIRFHTKHFEHTRRIAEAQHRRVMTSHTYEHRAQQLIDAARAWKACHAS